MSTAATAKKIAPAEEAPKPDAFEAARADLPDVAEEYASVTVTIDHLRMRATESGHTVVKDVWSTESAAESLLAQIDYFGQHGLLRDPGTIGMISKANDTAAAFVYSVNEGQTNIIVDLALWTDVFGNPEMGRSTVLGTHASFITLATELKRAAEAAGKPSNILAFLTNDANGEK